MQFHSILQQRRKRIIHIFIFIFLPVRGGNELQKQGTRTLPGTGTQQLAGLTVWGRSLTSLT